MHAQEAYQGGFIGGDFSIHQDLSSSLPEQSKVFRSAMIPVFLQHQPEKTKVAAALSCGFLWTISKGIQVGDMVLCPNGEGEYLVGEVTGEYEYKPEEILPHRRSVRWLPQNIAREEMSEALKNSSGSIGTVSNITKHAKELKMLIQGEALPTLISTDEGIDDPSAFALEKHLEDFLVENWSKTDLAKQYIIYEDDGQKIGQQYNTDTGPIDILAVSKNQKELLVIELKKGRASDRVVGQVQRYMGFIQDEVAEKGQVVRGLIIALKDDLNIRRALAVANNIDFYMYEIDFKLKKS